MRTNVNEFALINELGDEKVADLSAGAVFATGFSVEDRHNSLLVLLPLMAGSLEGAYDVLTGEELCALLGDVARALANLHAHGILHRDVAARNILLERREDASLPFQAKISDFGLACSVKSPWLPAYVPGDIWPPEVLGSMREVYGPAGDVWAFGLLLAEVFRRGRPAAARNVNHAWLSNQIQPPLEFDRFIQNILAGVSGQSLPEVVSSAAAKLHADRLMRYFSSKPTSRPLESYEIGAEAVAGEEILLASEWLARLRISPSDMESLDVIFSNVIPFLVSWCTRTVSSERPSMAMVALLFTLSTKSIASLPMAICHEFMHVSWTAADMVFLKCVIRICQQQWSMKHFNLKSCGFLPDNVKLLWDISAFAGARLEALDCNDNCLGDPGAMSMAQELRMNFFLTRLDLCNNGVDNAGAVALSEALKVNKRLLSLNMDSNTIGAVGGIALAKALAENSTLTTLSLYKNNVGLLAATAFGEAMHTNGTLTYLNIGCNDITDTGAASLGKALMVNHALTELGLFKNRIGTIGGRVFGEVLRHNTTLTVLDLGANMLWNVGVAPLALALPHNGALIELNLENNGVTDDGARMLSEALQHLPADRTFKLLFDDNEQGYLCTEALLGLVRVGLEVSVGAAVRRSRSRARSLAQDIAIFKEDIVGIKIDIE
jgi:serine/threonine protein kinase/Ran GTPase-activating protein (RanGAP) involved in mRNA processing and transport